MLNWSAAANVGSAFSGALAPAGFCFTITAIFVAPYVYFHSKGHESGTRIFLLACVIMGLFGILFLCVTPVYILDIATQPSAPSPSPANAALTCNALATDPDDITRVQASSSTVTDADISDPQEAINACSIALKTATGQTAARLEHQLARALRKIGQTDEADAKDHLASDAGYAPARAKWAEVLYKNHDYLGAFNLFSQAAPGSAEAMFWLGETFYLNGFPNIVPKDRAKGITLIQEAAGYNQPDALTHPCVVSYCSPN